MKKKIDLVVFVINGLCDLNVNVSESSWSTGIVLVRGNFWHGT